MGWAFRPMGCIAGGEAGRGQAAAGMLREDFKWEGFLEEVTGERPATWKNSVGEHDARCKWNKTRAGRKLGISPKTLLVNCAGRAWKSECD